jgi:hypothetical protein
MESVTENARAAPHLRNDLRAELNSIANRNLVVYQGRESGGPVLPSENIYISLPDCDRSCVPREIFDAWSTTKNASADYRGWLMMIANCRAATCSKTTVGPSVAIAYFHSKRC